MSDKNQAFTTALVITFALLGIVLALLSTSVFGVGLSSDAIGYISTARELAQGHGFVDYTGAPYVLWPPLLPLILAGFELVGGIDPVVSIRFFNAAVLGLTVLLAGWALVRYSPEPLPKRNLFLGLVWITCSVPLLQGAGMAWTEPLFILLALACLLCMSFYTLTNALRFLWLGCLLAALATLTRYIGLVLVITGTIAVFANHTTSLKIRIARALSFGVMASLPLAVWVLHNWLVSGTFFGERGGSIIPLFESLSLTANVIGIWFAPSDYASGGLLLIGLGVVVALIYLTRRRPDRQRTYASLAGPLGSFIVQYLIFLIASSTVFSYDPINDRLLAPLYLPVILLLFFVWQDLSGTLVPGRATAVIFLGVGLWAIYPVYQTFRQVGSLLEQGAGYASAAWRNSEVLAYLADNPSCEALKLYSNMPEALYIRGGLSAELSPRQVGYAEEMAALRETWPGSAPVCLVVFDQGRSHFLSVDELEALSPNIEITLLASLRDGSVYRVLRSTQAARID